MNVVAETAKPTRPVLRWYGGKWKLAPWVLDHLPRHRIYVEPFGGAGSVLIRKPRSYAEVYNDLDDQVVTLFRVLQDDVSAARLVEQLRVTPFARAEFDLAFSGEEIADPIERSRRLIIRAFMGFGSNAHAISPTSWKTGFRTFTRTKPIVGRGTGFRSNSNRSGTTPAHDWAGYPNALVNVIERFRGVVIECRDAFDVIAQHDSVETLLYVDPPYLPETRSPANKYDQKYRMYRHELDGGGHARLLEHLRSLTGMVVLSGYPSQLYDDALSDWRRVETPAHADGARPRTEVLWLNPACAAALDREHGGHGTPLFQASTRGEPHEADHGHLA